MTAPHAVDDKTYQLLTDLLEKHYKVVHTQDGERQAFRSCKQKPDQGIGDFVVELKKLSRYCRYGDHIKEFLKETFLMGLNNEFLKSRVMCDCEGKDCEEVVEKALTVGKIFKETQVYLKQEQSTPINSVTYINLIDHHQVNVTDVVEIMILKPVNIRL